MGQALSIKRVLLIVMPFATTANPAIGVSLLKARLNTEGIDCDIKYFNITFATMVGLKQYEEVCDSGGILLSGEVLFARTYFGQESCSGNRYLNDVSETVTGDAGRFLRIEKLVSPFLERCMESTCWDAYDVVGFSTTFEQNVASIALAHRIKELHPSKIIVFGGANCEGVMGAQLLQSFPFIDYVCSGESDFTFPELLKRLEKQASIEDIPCIVYRTNGKSTSTHGDPAVQDMDALPYPDYDDYFAQLEEASLPSSVCIRLPVETSRGCWWGERSKCRFCGIAGTSIHFRSKKRDRVLDELHYLVEQYAKKYKVGLIGMVDNVMDMKYFKDLFPELKQRHYPVQFSSEVRANLSKEQVRILTEAGVVTAGVGIESLSTHVLKLMSKGVSALRNIQFLKYCRQFDMFPAWSILVGFPGETGEDYRQIAKLIYKISHLHPPWVISRFQLERFSPYFIDPQPYGILKIRPQSVYRFIYPFNGSSLFNLAYFFEFDFSDQLKPPDFDGGLAEAVEYWKESHARGEDLCSIDISSSALRIEDGRPCAAVPYMMLESIQKEIYEYCDSIRSFPLILTHVRERYSRYPVATRDVKDFLEDMVSLNLMVNEGDMYLSLAIPAREASEKIVSS